MEAPGDRPHGPWARLAPLQQQLAPEVFPLEIPALKKGLSFNGVHPARFGPATCPFHDAITLLPTGLSLGADVKSEGIRLFKWR